MLSPHNVTGILERVPLFPWIRYLKDVVPYAESGLVLMDESPTSHAVLDVTFGKRKQVLVEGVEVDYKVAATWRDWQQQVQKAEEYDFVVLPVFHSIKNRQGGHIPVKEVIQWTSEHCRVPVFANQDYAVGDDGLVGAYVVRGEGHGRAAAVLALGILDNRTPQMPLINMDQKGQFFFNRKQLDRFNLSLPEKIAAQAIFR